MWQHVNKSRHPTGTGSSVLQRARLRGEHAAVPTVAQNGSQCRCACGTITTSSNVSSRRGYDNMLCVSMHSLYVASLLCCRPSNTFKIPQQVPFWYTCSRASEVVGSSGLQAGRFFYQRCCSHIVCHPSCLLCCCTCCPSTGPTAVACKDGRCNDALGGSLKEELLCLPCDSVAGAAGCSAHCDRSVTGSQRCVGVTEWK